jgi:hypothetical protein
MFPFNDLHRVGEFLIVAPHPKLCPLAVLPSGELSDASDHDDLFAMMCASGIGMHVGETAGNGADVPAVIALERRRCGLAEAQLHPTRYSTFDAAQLAASGQAPDGIDRFLEMLVEVLGERRPDGDDRDATLARTMVGMTPAIRARILFAYRDVPSRVLFFKRVGRQVNGRIEALDR